MAPKVLQPLADAAYAKYVRRPPMQTASSLGITSNGVFTCYDRRNICDLQITHMPPELINEGKMSKAVDVYGFGVLLWEVSPVQGFNLLG